MGNGHGHVPQQAGRPLRPATAVMFPPDGQLITSASFDKTVRVWKTTTGTCCNVLESHTDRVTVVVFSPDGQLIASASDEKTMRVWELVPGT